ncbi:MAG: hypothetical protein O3C60_17640, partial [Planctomycetota bacterium]|nr:hypothetical protein [Planctomycetota bacterium]
SVGAMFGPQDTEWLAMPQAIPTLSSEPMMKTWVPSDQKKIAPESFRGEWRDTSYQETEPTSQSSSVRLPEIAF